MDRYLIIQVFNRHNNDTDLSGFIGNSHFVDGYKAAISSARNADAFDHDTENGFMVFSIKREDITELVHTDGMSNILYTLTGILNRMIIDEIGEENGYVLDGFLLTRKMFMKILNLSAKYMISNDITVERLSVTHPNYIPMCLFYLCNIMRLRYEEFEKRSDPKYIWKYVNDAKDIWHYVNTAKDRSALIRSKIIEEVDKEYPFIKLDPFNVASRYDELHDAFMFINTKNIDRVSARTLSDYFQDWKVDTAPNGRNERNLYIERLQERLYGERRGYVKQKEKIRMK